MLQRGDLVPHFTVTDIDGHTLAYAGIWQHRNLVLISLQTDTSVSAEGTDRVASAVREHEDTTWIVTRDAVAGVPQPGVLVADRWGEIVHIAPAAPHTGLPDVDDLLEWLHFTRLRCPECEGEAK